MKQSIAIIDDLEDTVEFLEYNLSRHGFLTQSFSCPESAVRSIIKHPPSLIISDFMMPNMDGGELIETISTEQTNDKTPVILISCLSRHQLSPLLEKHDHVAFMEKPFKVTELIEKVNLIMNYNEK